MTRIDGPGSPLRPEGPRRPASPDAADDPSFREGLSDEPAGRVDAPTFERMAGPARARLLAGYEREAVVDALARDEAERAFGPAATDALVERVVTAFRDDSRLRALADRLLDRIDPAMR